MNPNIWWHWLPQADLRVWDLENVQRLDNPRDPIGQESHTMASKDRKLKRLTKPNLLDVTYTSSAQGDVQVGKIETEEDSVRTTKAEAREA